MPGGIRGAQVEPGTEEPSQGIGEAEKTRRPAEELSDSDRQQIVDRFRRGLSVAINKFRPLFDALGVPIQENEATHGAAIVPTENGGVARFNAAKLADGFYQDWIDGGTHYADQSLINLDHRFLKTEGGTAVVYQPRGRYFFNCGNFCRSRARWRLCFSTVRAVLLQYQNGLRTLERAQNTGV